MIKLKLMGAIIGLVALVTVLPTSIMAQNSFNEGDFKIKDFGVINGNPWLTVEGKAGGSKPQNASLIYSYIFVSGNGTFAVMSHLFDDTDEVENDTQWHTHRITLDDKNCVSQINDNGDTEINGLIKVTNVIVAQVNKVMTAELTLNNTNSVMCITKVFDSKLLNSTL